MNTHRRPARSSTATAVRTKTLRLSGVPLGAASGTRDGAAPSRCGAKLSARTAGSGNSSRDAKGSGGAVWRSASGGTGGSESSGSRKPIGESPGIRNRPPRWNFHSSLTQRGHAVARRTGNTKPAGSARRCSSVCTMRARARRSPGSAGSVVWVSPVRMRSTGSSKAGTTYSAAMPRRRARPSVKRRAAPAGGGWPPASGAIRVTWGPARQASPAPVGREARARQRLARIPFALAVKQKPAGREAIAQPADEIVRADALGGPERVRVPFGRLIVVERHEGRLAPHGEPDVLARQVLVDRGAELIQRGPGLIGKGPRDARFLGDARDRHLER